MPAQDDGSGFSWLTLFGVTGVSGFGFSLFMKLLDGYYPVILLWVGVTGTALALLSLLFRFLYKYSRSARTEKQEKD